MKTFSSVWLHSKKCFGKYFLVFGCVLENALENPFLSCFSHFPRIQTNIITKNQNTETQRNKNQNKKNQNHKTNRERGVEIEREIK